ncbi:MULTISPECIES: M23 family metallopeptidase [unclassified Dyella]|uniref:M23 family metallopeptidase n=1 Tax=unclassified Dyella TaxID=2634549 RepID=UPI000C827DD1|nr:MULTISPECIES: M23 family metallopeptidase [unclassified Dyella]MDR3443933.1 M23 family metallopeptidase [Dyella sp.]PMQ04768.1 Murein DD-endopeptidase MepM [Dyella sp. AD56]
MRSWRDVVFVLLAALVAQIALAQRTPLHQSFDLRVPWIPQPVVVAGKTSLVYELNLGNDAQEPLTLRRIVVADDQQHVLLDLQGEPLVAAIGRADRAKGDDRLRIAPAMMAVAYLSVPIADARVAHLHHRVVYVDATGHEITLEGAEVMPVALSAKPLGPPLRGGPWVAIYDASWERGHRRVIYATDGSAKIPGRFAIDWIRVGAHDGFAHGKGDKPAQWYGYGADVLAVADAVVASVGEGVAEPATLAEGAARKVPLEDAAGNYVSLDLGDGRFAFYEHLKPGSIKVEPGDHVRTGEVIGQLGFTGESTGPHLHFHVSDANAPLAAQGLPYDLASFRMLGSYPFIEDFAQGKAWRSVAKPANSEGFPPPLAVVDFGDAR